jgi:hypothetical protein
MAPERYTAGRDDHRVDVYALGCVLHEVLTGRKPFDGDDAARQMYAHVHLPPPRPSLVRPGLPVALDAVVATALAKDPDQRYRSAGELAAAARAALAPAAPPTLIGPPPVPAGDPWRRRAIAAMVVAAVALLGAGVAIGIAVAGAVGGDGPGTNAAAPAGTPATTTRPGVPVPGSPAGSGPTVTLAEQGTPVRDGGIEVTVTAAHLTDSVELGDEVRGYTDTPAGPGARFVVVEARVVNDTDASVSISCGGVPTAVIDERARKFDPILESYQARGNSHCSPPLQPGFEGTSTWVYRVPAEAAVTTFVFMDPKSGRPLTASSTGVRLDLAS